MEKTQKNIDEAPESVLQRAADFGITFNLEKCQFDVSEIDFYAHRFTQDGLKQSRVKIRAVQETRAPELGMTSYRNSFLDIHP